MDRETLLAVTGRQPQPPSPDTPVSVQHICSQISYSSFLRDHLIQNRPCVLSRTFTRNWNCTTTWLQQDGTPDFHSLLDIFGDSAVPVADCSVKEYNSNPKQNLTFREFLHHWDQVLQNDSCSPSTCLYLKDWHMTRMFPELDAYITPIYFSSDWLNEFWDVQREDDYRFVYMGPKGSWTPFHADVFRSYSWSANVCGRKRWLLYAPGQEEFLRNVRGDLPYDITAPELQDPQNYPRCHEAPPPLEVIQEAGEIIFIPSGWFHQVHNLEDTISINHNWVNGCNVGVVWRFLQAELRAVQREIEEWRESMESWDQHCQVMMRSCTGMNYAGFAAFLRAIARNRINFLTSGQDLTSTGSLTALGPHHAVFDLQRALHILQLMQTDQDFQRVALSELDFNLEELLQDITLTITSYHPPPPRVRTRIITEPYGGEPASEVNTEPQH